VKKSIIPIISLFIVMFSTSLAIAGGGVEAVWEPTIHNVMKEDEEWFTYWSFQFGTKELDDEWQDSHHPYYGMMFTVPLFFPLRESFSLSEPLPPFFLDLGFFRTKERDKNEIDHYYSTEVDIGIKYLISFKSINLYLGGGLSLVYAHSDIMDPTAKINGYDYGAGYLVNAGIDYLIKGREDAISIGFFVKHSNVYLNDFEVNGGGLYYGIKIGIPVSESMGFPSV